ncbi:BREX system Lon protease-like protein BrxL [Desulfococcaceae bacterium HSG9]|nr:BREX system Lon protease-like protein BrxL [Desulfococcaceae bacterium HSG9]
MAFIIEHITELIAGFIRRNHLEEKSKIFFISEHGSALIAKGVKNEIDTSYFKEIATDYNHRYISLDEKKFNQIKTNKNISDAIFPLDKEFSGDGKNYVIARGYNRFKELHDEFYVHDGALPEKIIVPAGYFVYSTRDSQPLIIQLIKDEYRLKVKETLKLRIANPNDRPVKNIHIDVLADGLTLAETEEKLLKEQADKNRLFEQEEVKILDNFSVSVNLAKGDRYLNIPFLDETSAFVSSQIVQENEMLLNSGLWGVGPLFYMPPTDEKSKGQLWMKELKPFQLANLDISYFFECRKYFNTLQWLDLLVSSMGFNHRIYSERQKILLISRLIPMVEPRFNLVEPAPKGTGKSFVFENMSRYVAVRSGSISPAVLFYNDARKIPGLITRYDCVVLDEAQKVKTDSSGKLTALLKSYKVNRDFPQKQYTQNHMLAFWYSSSVLCSVFTASWMQ